MQNAPAPGFAWDELGRYKREGQFLPGYPEDTRTFFAPRDDVHGLLKALLESANHSIVISMFGFDDDELDAVIRAKLDDKHVFVQANLDRSQSRGKHEREILTRWKADDLANSVAIGNSEKGAISHLKVLIVDGVYTVSGSTNWSASGQGKQDNELTLSRNATRAAEFRSVCDRVHDHMLQQQHRRLAGAAKLVK